MRSGSGLVFLKTLKDTALETGKAGYSREQIVFSSSGDSKVYSQKSKLPARKIQSPDVRNAFK